MECLWLCAPSQPSSRLTSPPTSRRGSAVTSAAVGEAGYPLLAGRAITGRLLHRFVNLFWGQQDGRFDRRCSAGACHQGDRRHADVVGQLSNNILVGFTEGIVKGFNGSTH